MHQISFFAYHASRPLPVDEIARAVDDFAEIYDYTRLDRSSIANLLGPHTGLAVFDPTSRHLRVPLVVERPTYLGVSLHMPFGVSEVLPRERIRTGDYIGDLLASRDRAEALKRCDPPAVLCDYAHDTSTVRLINDALGYGRLYEYRRGGLTVWSNKPAAGYIVEGAVPEIDTEAWRLYAAFGWFGGDLTPYRHVRRVNGEAYIVAGRSGVQRWGLAEFSSRLKSGEKLDEGQVDDIAHALTRKFREMQFFADVPKISFGLSGGRDSRTVAAAALAAGVDLKLSTSYPPMPEVELARELVRRSSVGLDWREFDRRTPATMQKVSIDPGAISTALIYSYRFCDGDSLAYIHKPVTPDTMYLTHFVTYSTGGVAGEFGHANGYLEADLERPVEDRIERARRSWRAVPLARPEGKEALLRLYGDIMDEGSAWGLSGYHLLDYWYVYGRFRRWGGGNLGVETVQPLLTSAYLEHAFSQPPEEKLSADLQRRLIARLKPEWSAVPFMFEVVKDLPPRERSNPGSLPFLWETGRWPEVIRLINDHEAYGDCFNRPEVLRVCASPEETIPSEQHIRYQGILDRILWRIGLDMHCDRIRRTVVRRSTVALAERMHS